jgi:threonylcarbamoyladenosine tRNA methylthiotransferase MtaB
MSRNLAAAGSQSGVDVINFGCRVNSAESAAILSLARNAGHTDLVVVNTCAVTAEAVRQARQAIRRSRRTRPDTPIVVTGCAAEIEPSTFSEMSEVARIVGNGPKILPATWQRCPSEGRLDPAAVRAGSADAAALADRSERRTRAFVQVQNGCDHRCTFCVIPLGRGMSRSISSEVVIEQIRQLVAGGYLEVVLTGIDITSYGLDLSGNPGLGALVCAILRAIPDLRRLRLSSVDSVEVDDVLMRAFASEPRLMPQLHLSLQAGSDLILKRMKRRHRRSDAIAFCSRLRRLRPDIVFGADLIVGFPTETEMDFAGTLALIEDCALANCHVFPFSARPTTPAARMPQLDPPLIKERALRLRERADAAWVRHLRAQIGRRLPILTERGGIGRSEDFTKVRYFGSAAGILCDVTISGANDKELLANPLDQAL